MQVERVILLSGKIYYDLVKERRARGFDDRVALIRIEELSPFPFQDLRSVLKRYTFASEFFFLQEEPKNQGVYTHVCSRINTVLADIGTSTVMYKGRMESALPAPGIGKIYAEQQKAVIEGAFDSL
jgi:probable 2-oxoglutarate dehydrogenase E1 component DHKTD1